MIGRTFKPCAAVAMSRRRAPTTDRGRTRPAKHGGHWSRKSPIDRGGGSGLRNAAYNRLCALSRGHKLSLCSINIFYDGDRHDRKPEN